MKPRSLHGLWPLLLALSIASLPASVRGKDFERSFTLAGEKLVLVNLVGEIQVVGHDGSSFEVEVAIRGRDASPERIRIETEENGKAQLSILFPVTESRRFVYPRIGKSSSTTLSFDQDRQGDGGWFARLLPFLQGKTVRVHGSGEGLEIWADVTVKVPPGGGIVVRHGVGSIDAKGIAGDAFLSTHSGSVGARRIAGDLVIDTGSGSVEVEEVEGDVNVDTGSGSVELSRCTAGLVLVDTGSGSVKAAEISCNRLDIDTGSGRVQALAVEAGGARIDTGSGSVELDLQRMGSGSFVIDTGSGAIDLRLPAGASAEITASTGSGRIVCDLPDAQFKTKERDEVTLRLGEGAARVRLDAGSGSVRIHR